MESKLGTMLYFISNIPMFCLYIHLLCVIELHDREASFLFKPSVAGSCVDAHAPWFRLTVIEGKVQRKDGYRKAHNEESSNDRRATPRMKCTLNISNVI